MRQWLNRAGQGRVIGLLAVALLIRALVPTGWMPVATVHGVSFQLCADQSPVLMAGMHHGQAEHEGQAVPDQPCAFAGLGLAVDMAPPLVLLAQAIVATATPAPRPFAVTIGQGLAAPPPPSTGPPAFA